MLREAADIPVHIRMADTFDHRQSAGFKAAHSPVSLYRSGKIDWILLSNTLDEIFFYGTLFACIFALENHAEGSTPKIGN